MQLRERARKAGCGTSGMTIPFAFHRIMGVAMANDTVAYVLHEDGVFATRDEIGISIDPMIMQLRLRPQGWRVFPTPTTLGRTGIAYQMSQCDSGGGRPRG